MLLVQMQYWITMYPAVFADRDVNALPRGGTQLGTWSLTVEDMTKKELLASLKHLYYDPLREVEKARQLNVYQATELEAVRQIKHLFSLGKRTDVPDLVTLQHVEYLESGHLCIVHNIQCRQVAEF